MERSRRRGCGREMGQKVWSDYKPAAARGTWVVVSDDTVKV